MRPQPVLIRAAVAAVIAAAAAVLQLFGVELPGDFSGTSTDAVYGVVSVVSILLAALSARNKVTPLSDPVATVSVPLVAAETPHDVDDSE